MPENINEIIFKTETLINLRNDTVEPSKLYKGVTAHDKSGSVITGTAEVTVSGTTLIVPEGFITVT